MIRRIISRKRIAVASVLALGVVTTILAVAFMNQSSQALPEPLPPMTLTYEVYGPSVGVGERSIPAFKQVKRLEYRSQTDWTETVIESPELDLGRYGTATHQGSYRTLKGDTLTEYDALTDTTLTSSVGEGIFLPNTNLGHSYTPIGESPIGTGAGVAADTDVRVCVVGNCTENVAGVKYTKGDSELVVYQGDGWIIPVKDGDTFNLKSADVPSSTTQ